jgi:flagellar hook protein FlgE
MMTAFSTALSALDATSVGIDVIGNNLANLNTPGFKASVVQFHDLMAQTLGATGTGAQVGLGTGPPQTVRQFSQGTIQTSSGAMDAAIQGAGFFIVKDSNNRQLYTRAGNLQVSGSGNLLTATGERVQGWREVNGIVDPNTAVGDIVISIGSLQAPVATTQMTIDGNLNASGVVGQPSGSFSTPIEVVDSLGVSHVVSITFTKTAANTWGYQASIAGADVTAGTVGTPYNIPGTSGSITFNAQGVMTAPAPPPPAGNGVVTVAIAGLRNGAADMSVAWNLYNGVTPRFTQFAQPSAVSANSQNGTFPAQLTQVGLSDGGQIMAQFSNGRQQLVAQLALAFIRNPDSLVSVGNNNLQAGVETALPAIGTADTGGRGRILGGALEGSTVDIAREFTNLIVMQRGYQANARMVTTADELTQETINLKR